MIYSSMYREVIDPVDRLLSAKVPGVKIEWLQSGSEKIATRLDAELAAGQTAADLVMTSDPLWYERLKREGHLLPYASIRALAMPRELVDPEGAFVTSRISVMVLAYNGRLVSDADAPASFADLFTPRWAGKVTFPDPLGSGTTYSTLAFLVDAMGMEVIDRMKEAQAVSAGGNSAAFARLEAGEHQVGFLLVENVLAGKRNGSPVAYKIPTEGAVLIPGPIAIMKRSRNPVAARAVYDAILSPEVQALIVKGDLYSPFADVPPPAGLPPLDALLGGRFQWTRAFIDRAMAKTDVVRRRFAEVMGGK